MAPGKAKEYAAYSEWVPRAYLEQYYSTTDLAEDEKVIYGFIKQFLKDNNPKFVNMLEFGCGPTIHHVIPFAPYVNQIHLADYREENLQEIEKWLKGSTDAHDWSMYIKGALEVEGITEHRAVTERANLIKKKVSRLLVGDVFQKYPLGSKETFSLVTSFYCVDCATDSPEKWKEVVTNLFNLVAPGGWLIMSALRKAERYKVKDKYFPSANLHEKDVEEALNNYFVKDSVVVEAHPIAMWSGEGFDGIIVSKAAKTYE